MNTLNLSTLQTLQHFSPRMQKSVTKILSKSIYPISQRVHCQPAARNLSEVKRKYLLQYKDEVHELSLKGTTWKQRKSLLSSKKGILLIKTISPIVINRLS